MPRTMGTVLLLMAAFAQAAVPAQPDAGELEELEEVVVVGRYPGPPLWKISNGGNALWILPLVDMYPGKMEWESARVERLIAESREYLNRPTVSGGFSLSSVNPLSLSRVLGLYNKTTYLPGGKTLADVLPPDLYRRFKVLKSRYFPRNSKIERMTLDAAQRAMRQAILERENLEMLTSRFDSPQLITRKTSPWLKANKSIRRIDPGYYSQSYAASSKEIKALGKVMEEVRKSASSEAQEVACFETAIAYFENDLEAAKRRANAWAQGHADDLVSPTKPYSGDACRNPFAALQGIPAAEKFSKEHPDFAAALSADRQQMKQISNERWLAAAERALAANTTTFALLSVDDMLGTEGLVARLQEKGYTVEISAE